MGKRAVVQRHSLKRHGSDLSVPVGGSDESDQARAVRTALDGADLQGLRHLAFSQYGFCSPELRRAVWMRLLGLSMKGVKGDGWKQYLPDEGGDNGDARVMQADVRRSVYSWDVHVGIREKARNQKRVELAELMKAILGKHGCKFNYFQGFHDIALVFLEVGTPAHAFCMVDRLALFHLSDQLCWPFDTGLMRLISVLFLLVELLDPELTAAFCESDCGELHFTLPWVLTWFSHSLPKLNQVMRLFDCLLVSHPATILYFCASLLMQNRELILQTPREMPDMMSAIQGICLAELNIDDWAYLVRGLMNELPPEEFVTLIPPEKEGTMPATSPLWHFPHPWMGEVDPPLFGGSASRGCDVMTDAEAVAPVYRMDLGVPRRARNCSGAFVARKHRLQQDRQAVQGHVSKGRFSSMLAEFSKGQVARLLLAFCAVILAWAWSMKRVPFLQQG